MFTRLLSLFRKDNPVGKLDPYLVSGSPVAPPDNYEELSEQGYLRCAIGYSAINKVADTAANLPLKLQRCGKGGKWEDLDASEDDEHPLMQLLRRPNPTMTKASFFGAVFKNRLMVGEGAIAQFGAGGVPKELWAIRTDQLHCAPGAPGSPRAWVYKSGQGEYVFDMLLEQKPLLFWKTYNPMNVWRGAAPLRAAATHIATHNGASLWNANTMKNGMRPMGAFNYTKGDKTGRPLSPAQRKQLDADINKMLMGQDNSGRPLILDGMTFQEMSINAKDMDWLEGRRDADRIISLVVGCPPIILGIQGDSTYRNYEEARLSLFQDSAMPLMQSLLDELNEWIVPEFGEGLRLCIDRKLIDALAEIFAKELERIDKVGCMSVDEKRERIGLKALNTPGSKMVFISSSMVPIDMAAEPPADPGTEGVDDNGDPLPPGKKPKPGDPPPKPGAKPLPKLGKELKGLEDNLLRLAATLR